MGDKLQWQCQMVLGGSPGKIDLCVVFHRRAVDLLRCTGCYGLLANTNIAQGDSIKVGLSVINQFGSIFSSRRGVQWPGSAAVVVAQVCFIKGAWNAVCDADGHKCTRIGPRLEPEAAGAWVPQTLSDALFAFEGVNNSKGLAFLITLDSPWFERLKNEPDSLLRPYITGDDITSSALNRIGRWALDIGDLSLVEIALRWPIAHRFLVEVVKPTRTTTSLKSYKGLIDIWWQFWRHRSSMMRRIRARKMFIAYAKTTKFPVPILATSDAIYTNNVVLLEFSRPDALCICLSTAFRSWLAHFSGASYGEIVKVSISGAIETFPAPTTHVSELGVIAAESFNSLSIELSKERNCGVTEVINAVNTPSENGLEVAELRRLMAVIDVEVVTAYGWSNANIHYDFREFSGSANDSWRWALSEDVTVDFLGLLTTLNRERFESNERNADDSLVLNKPKRGRRENVPPAVAIRGLFDEVGE